MIRTLEAALENPGEISEDDMNMWQDVIAGAAMVYVERDNLRRGLWKQYSAHDQVRQMKIKVERVEHALRLPLEVPAQQMVIAEVYDIINYGVFTARLVGGTV